MQDFLPEKIPGHTVSAYIVIDLEWNQPIPWIRSKVDPKELPGEIIEIGAVKLLVKDDGLEISKPFHVMIRPVCYTVMNRNVSRVINKISSDLRCGMHFLEAYDAFREWCGEDFILCGWGNSDLSILKANLRFHGRPDRLNTRFLDVQPLFSKIAENENKQRSVEYAVDFLEISKLEEFHEAHRDAEYTGRILLKLFEMLNKEADTIPQKTGPGLILNQYLYDPDLAAQTFRNTETYRSWEECFSKNSSMECLCPACGEAMSAGISWFRLKKSAFSLWRCQEHNLAAGRMRLKKNNEGKYYASITVRLVNPAGEKSVMDRLEEYQEFGTAGKPPLPTPGNTQQPEAQEAEVTGTSQHE
jgi:inhibitor of KinA sporulation pathway (predicted exonuclease)